MRKHIGMLFAIGVLGVACLGAVGLAEDKVVIHHTAAFSGELKLLKELLTKTSRRPPSRPGYSWRYLRCGIRRKQNPGRLRSLRRCLFHAGAIRA